MSSFLTIDYDFFVRHEMHKDVRMPDGGMLSGMLVYDWQMNEGRLPMLDEQIWLGRAASFKRWGLDIQARTAPELSFQDFMLELGIRADTHVPAWRSDSHAWAGGIARDYANQFGPLSVLNFDAHHDLGYDSDVISRYAKSEHGSIHCDDWAVIGLHEGWIRNYTVVYPDWLGSWEWSSRIKRPWLKEFRGRYRTTTWSEWLQSGKEIRNLEVAHFCRSSSWVPPWHDSGFSDLCEEFGYVGCLDCDFGQHNSPYDTCAHRAWDWQQVEDEIKLREEMHKLLLTLNQGLTG